MILKNLLKTYRELIQNNKTCLSSFHLHLLWMIDEINRMIQTIDDDKIDKLFKINRWVGFIQGYLHSNKLRTIEELKNETRGIDNELFEMLER